jgi:cell division protein FtsB
MSPGIGAVQVLRSTEAIKEQQRQNEELRARIVDLEAVILRLETAITGGNK